MSDLPQLVAEARLAVSGALAVAEEAVDSPFDRLASERLHAIRAALDALDARVLRDDAPGDSAEAPADDGR